MLPLLKMGTPPFLRGPAFCVAPRHLLLDLPKINCPQVTLTGMVFALVLSFLGKCNIWLFCQWHWRMLSPQSGAAFLQCPVTAVLRRFPCMHLYGLNQGIPKHPFSLGMMSFTVQTWSRWKGSVLDRNKAEWMDPYGSQLFLGMLQPLLRHVSVLN